jgi:GTP-dependent phosphoenolpyruvate carboxykinase
MKMLEKKYTHVCFDDQKSAVVWLVTNHPTSMQNMMVVIYAGIMRAKRFFV